jgi:hypothetical protein
VRRGRQELHAAKKLFQPAEYRTLRSAFAGRFERAHKDTIRRAYGEDFDKLSTWLEENREIKEDFYTAIDTEHDKVDAALTIFKDLWKAQPDKVKAFHNLAIAVAVTWDKPQGAVYDYRHHQTRCRATLPEGGVEALENFRYLVENDAKLQGRPKSLPWEFQIYMVDHKTPLPERNWAMQNYLNRRVMIGKCYHDVPYDYGMLTDKEPKLSGYPYTLENIKKQGGVCAMQADFSSRVGKSIGAPAAYVRGQANSGGLHAWVMWVEVKQAAPGRIVFSMESHGRYNIDNYDTGELDDPQTGKEILDREMELRLWNAGSDTTAKRHAGLAMRAFPILRDVLPMEPSAQLAFLRQCITFRPLGEEPWTAMAALCKDRKLDAKRDGPAVTESVRTLFAVFARFPDFTWKVFDDLVAIQTDEKTRTAFYLELVRFYDKSARPDLACEACLKLTDYLEAGKRLNEAAVALAAVIRRFPDEGRYIPKLMDRLEKVCGSYPEGKNILMKFYVEILPKIPPRRGDEVSGYCLAMYQRAIKYFRDNNQTKAADELEKQMPRTTKAAVKS